MMRPADVSFDPGRGDRGSGIIQRSGLIPAPVLIQDSIVPAILQRGLGATFETLSAHDLAWCRVIVELPHHKGGIGITPLPARAWQRFTARLLKCFLGWVRSFTPPNGLLIRIWDAPAPDAPAQVRDDDSARPLSLPPLNLFASLRVRQDVVNGEAAARPLVPPERQVTKVVMVQAFFLSP